MYISFIKNCKYIFEYFGRCKCFDQWRNWTCTAGRIDGFQTRCALVARSLGPSPLGGGVSEPTYLSLSSCLCILSILKVQFVRILVQIPCVNSRCNSSGPILWWPCEWITRDDTSMWIFAWKIRWRKFGGRRIWFVISSRDIEFCKYYSLLRD